MKRHYLLLLPLLAACAEHKKEEEEKPVVFVAIAKAGQQDIALSVHAPATIFPREQASVASRLTAPIAQLLVRKGDSVSKGQILAKLDNRDIASQRQELAAQVTDAQATLDKLRSGTVPADLDRARGQVATTEAAFKQAESFYNRRKQLFEQGAIPQRDLLTSQTDLATAKANYDVAKTALQLLEKQSVGRDIEIYQSRIEQAKGRLAVNETQLLFSEVRSPFAGTITDQFVYPGDMAQPTSPMFTVADLSIAIARAQVPESEASAIKKGAVCEFQSQDHATAKYKGTISVINQAVDPQRRTVEVWCEIPNGKGELRAQVFGNIEIVTGALTQAVTVPLGAVQFEEGTRKGSVFLVNAEKKATKKEVVTGATVNGMVPILEGLKPGETVVIQGGYGIPEGTELTWEGDKREAKKAEKK